MQRVRVKVLMSALTLTAATGAAWLGLATPAQAATCYWYSGQTGTSSNCDNQDPDVLAKLSHGLGEPMHGLEIDSLETRLQDRGW